MHREYADIVIGAATPGPCPDCFPAIFNVMEHPLLSTSAATDLTAILMMPSRRNMHRNRPHGIE
jgi:hypothetical protein